MIIISRFNKLYYTRYFVNKVYTFCDLKSERLRNFLKGSVAIIFNVPLNCTLYNLGLIIRKIQIEFVKVVHILKEMYTLLGQTLKM